MIEIEISTITASPFQNRRSFTKLDELAASIKRDGLISPVVVRPLGGGYELIVGERRLRAVETFAKKILARVLPLTDLEARRWVATENMQRENLSSIEEVDGIVEMLDAELFDFLNYAGYADNSKLRVKYLLGKLDSDRRNETDFFTHKFVGKVESIFSALPTRKDWRSFYVHDLPLLNIASEVLVVSVANKLNASQTRALNNLNKTAPEKFKELVAKTDENGVVLLGKDDAGEALTLQNTSAIEIKNTVAKADLACFRSSDSNEWYTPEKYMEAVSKFFGGIDLDPCSCEKANKTVKAKSIFTIADDSLTKEWAGKVFLNPPYGKDGGDSVAGIFCNKAIDEYAKGNAKEVIILVNSSHSQKWQKPLYEHTVCFVDHRISFIADSGVQNDNPTFNNIFVYLGNRKAEFAKQFASFGFVMGLINA